MQNVTLHVQGMSCAHCVNSIEGSVGKLEGVEQVKVNLATGQVDIVFNEEQISLNQITETIDDQGYDVV